MLDSRDAVGKDQSSKDSLGTRSILRQLLRCLSAMVSLKDGRLTQVEVVIVAADAGANDRRQPALTPEKKTFKGCILPFL